MLTYILWGLLIALLISAGLFIDRRTKKKQSYTPYREKTEQEKELERKVEIEKTKRGGPPFAGGM